MTDDIINSAIFYFVCGTFDVLITILVLMGNIGVEANPVWNWISPKELMLIVCVVANLALGVFIIGMAPYIKTNWWRTVLKCGLYGEGLGRLAFGAVPGILLMVGAGWI